MSSVTSHLNILVWYMLPHPTLIICDIHNVFISEYCNLMRSMVYSQHNIILWDIHIDSIFKDDTLRYSWWLYIRILYVEISMLYSHHTIVIWDMYVEVTSEYDNLRCSWLHQIYIYWFEICMVRSHLNIRNWYVHDISTDWYVQMHIMHLHLLMIIWDIHDAFIAA